MRTARRIFLVLAGGGLLFFLTADMLAGALLGAPGNRTRILGVIGRAVGGEVEARTFSAALVPPTLHFEDVRVVGDEAGMPAIMEAPGIDVGFSVASLLAGVGTPESLAIEAPVLRIVRTAVGSSFPALPLVSHARSRESSRSDLGFGVRALSASDGEVYCEDHTVSPPRMGWVRGVAFSFRGSGNGSAALFELLMTPDAGSRLWARGKRGSGGRFEWSGEFQNFAVESLLACIPFAPDLGGRASGNVRPHGSTGPVLRWVGEFEVEDARFVLRDLEIEGWLGVDFEIDGSLAGRFRVDATRAVVRLGGVYAKQAGKTAEITGRFVGSNGGVDVDEVRLRIGAPLSGVSARGWQVAARRPNSWRTGERDGFER